MHDAHSLKRSYVVRVTTKIASGPEKLSRLFIKHFVHCITGDEGMSFNKILCTRKSPMLLKKQSVRQCQT